MTSRPVARFLILFSVPALVAIAALSPSPLNAQAGDGASVAEDNRDGDYDRGYDHDRDPRVRIGFRIAPVPLNFRRSDRELVGLGSYLVNAAGGCNDCHINPSYAPRGNPFNGEPEQINQEGYLAGGTAFGPFTSRNLTPDANGLPARLTLREFLRTMRTGYDVKQRHPEISPLLQVMPWPVYGKLQTRELRAIYAFLKAIPSAGRGTP